MQIPRNTWVSRLWLLYFSRRWLNLKRLIKYHNLDTFIAVNIETTTACNFSCSYCPVSTHPREYKLMSCECIATISDDLKDMRFDGIIHLHNYGEPLLDMRLELIVQYLHRNLPKCPIVLITNGSLLTQERYDILVNCGVTRFEIIKHTEEPIKLPKRLSVPTYYGPFESGYTVFNRGGLIEGPFKPSKRCFVHQDCLVINAWGDVILCCNDYFSTVKFGNVMDNSIEEIWNSYKDTRKDISNGVYKYDVCKNCGRYVV